MKVLGALYSGPLPCWGHQERLSRGKDHQAQMLTMKTKGRGEFIKQRKQQMQRPRDRREHRAFKKLKQRPE